MRVKFENCEVDVWKLRKGVVLGCGSNFVHLVGFGVKEPGVKIRVQFYDGDICTYHSHELEWLQPS